MKSKMCKHRDRLCRWLKGGLIGEPCDHCRDKRGDEIIRDLLRKRDKILAIDAPDENKTIKELLKDMDDLISLRSKQINNA